MFCSRILVAFDESELAMKSLETAIELAKLDPTIEVELLHSVSLPIHLDTYGKNNSNIEESLMAHGKEVISIAEVKLAKIPNTTHSYILIGAPSRAILDHAQAYDCDLIIMGSRGLSGIKEFLGSVSHYVVQHSPIPVMLIK